VEEFAPVIAKYIRFTVLETSGSEAGLDELEVYAADGKGGNLALAAAGGRASASGSLPGFPQHSLANINDGLYGNNHCWIADALSNCWAQIELARPVLIGKVVWGRDREGVFIDRTPIRYRVETAFEPGKWRIAATSDGRETGVAGTLNMARANGVEFPDGFVPLAPDRDARVRQPSDNYLTETWQSDDGLPENSVFSIAQTKDGYIWLATGDGLVRFDGARFVVFRPENAPGLPGAAISKVYGDRRGRLWISATASHLARLDRDGFAPIPWPESRFGICEFAEDGAGVLWAASRKCVRPWVNNRWGTALPAPPGRGIAHLAALSNGEVWAVLDRGFAKVSASGLSLASGSIDLLNSFMASRRTGGFWAVDGKAQVYSGSSGGIAKFSAPGMGDRRENFFSMLEDRAGTLWIGSYGGGLTRLVSGGPAEIFSRNRGLASNFITALFEDREGNLWVATGGGGVTRLKRRTFQMIDGRAGLANPRIHAVCEGPNGEIYLGSAGDGLCRWRGNQLAKLPGFSGLTFVWAAHCDREGGLWAGGFGSGLTRYQGSNPVEYHKLENGDILSILEDRAGNVWAGSREGLGVWRNREFVNYTMADGLSGKEVTAIAEDGAGGLWVGTSEGGLDHFREGKFENFGKKDGLAGDSVRSLLLDSGGTLWAGTGGGGLSRWRNGRFISYTPEGGLADGFICGIAEDGLGSLWMSSHHEIFRVSRKELDEFAAGEIPKIHCALFGVDDGLNTRECSGGSQPTVCRSRDGRLWFATGNGLAVVNPKEVPLNSEAPPVVIEELVVDGKSDEAFAGFRPGAVSIPAGRQRLEIHFTALSLTSPEKNRFRYKMEGFDTDWSEPDASRVATYTRLPPGRRVFRVMAANNDGVWNLEGASLELYVEPRFWQRRLVQTTAALLAAAAAVWLTRIVSLRRIQARVRELERQSAVERERARIARDIHDDIGASLSQIGILCEIARGKLARPEQAGADVSKIAVASRDAVERLDEIVWAVSPRHDTLESLASYLSYYVEEFFKETAFRVRQEIPAALPQRPLSSEARHNLFLAVKEALNNTLRHSGAAEVRLLVDWRDPELVVTVEDNGRGFDPNAGNSPGNGLRNLRQRLEDLGGFCEIASQPGRGTAVRFILSVPEKPN
jgi:signal transduction histidine kinase/ligand-binding sensor domain-containing protein